MRKRAISTATFVFIAITASTVTAATIGGTVTGGTAAANGGMFNLLSVPWGSASTPANTVGNNNFNTWNLNAFDEVQNYTLTSALVTSSGTIAAGTVVDVQYVFFDPPGNGGNLIGTVQFNGPVLGLITSDAGLTATNFLGDSGISYQDPGDVGLEAGDSVTIDGTIPNQIDWNTSASNPGDSVRVITGTAIPEPGSVALIGSGLAAILFLLRRRQTKAC